MWDVRFLKEASAERDRMPAAEQLALDRAIDKLAAFGPQLPFPHQSSIRQGEGLRELRPRAGRSPWRAFYCRRAEVFVITAIGPEAETGRRGFARAIGDSLRRLEELERP